RYMELALYAPGLGYYSGGATKLGQEGDFTTAPEMTPLFGATLAQVVAEVLPDTAPQIIEFGAGSGKLAFDLLTELAAMKVPLRRYAIVEVSGELRARQQKLLARFEQVVWLEHFPPAFAGVVLGNEVLDAMPVHLVVKSEQGWRERGIGLAGVAGRQLVFRDRPCDPSLIAQIPDPDGLPLGYLTEVHPLSTAFVASLGSMLNAAFDESGQGSIALLIDYGFPAREYYLAQRERGTLMCHYRHHAHDDPFYLPGLQDITCHVDFTAIAQAALDSGLDLLGYFSQAAFLIDGGIGELLLRTSPDDVRRYMPQANAVQKLTAPSEMGELFKVLAIGRKMRLPARFARGDRSHRL
ncbi:MAG: SAM-dependent methyltransferase, partial [Pseudomonadota bacterium]|nr:SAM-dependent methyltransferase [Pseudomonadota bacterium]